MALHLILGGARSGKSRLGVQLAQASGLEVFFVATASPDTDTEMTARIQRHQAARPSHWHLIEEPIKLAQTLAKYATPNRFVLVDCLTLWLANLLFATTSKTLLQQERQALLEQIPLLTSEIIFISNEIGQGIIPMGEINRRFVDESGLLHQDLAQACDRVTFMTAGLPIILKGDPS